MKVFFDTLGCPKAQVDAERMCYFLNHADHTLTSDPEEADAIVVNTCGFIESAKEESISVILNYIELKKKKPGLKIILAGCLTERYKQELLENLPEVDSAIGVRDLTKIVQALDAHSDKLLDEGTFQDDSFSTERSLTFSGNHFAYLKIAEGCNRSCSFCAIPGIRGKQRSRKIEDIIKEAKFLLENGIRELILVSEDTISYGSDIYQKRALKELLIELIRLDFQWIRIMYLFPEDEVYDIIQLMSDSDKICNYLDMPLQHISSSILRSMKRAGSSGEYLNMINKIRQINPEIRIRSSFIVGYPGETDLDFEEFKTFLKEAGFDRVGFFEFSPEEGTSAYSLEKLQVPSKIARKRIKELAKIQEGISRQNLEKLVGKKLICINDGMIQEEGNRTYAVFRSEYDAPEIDGRVFAEITPDNSPEEAFSSIRIDSVKDNHDLSGSLMTK